MDTTLEARIRRLEDIEEIKQLKARYCLACDDDHNPDAVAALFVEDGVWGGNSGVDAHGHAEIKAFFQSVRGAGFMKRSAHMVFNPVITVEGDKASGLWRLLMMYTGADEAGAPQFTRIIGHYRESYVRTAAGWRFERLYVTVEEAGPYAMVAASGWPATAEA